MLVTVSTVKDTLSNITKFVSGNLANGVDHMFVFMDGEAPEVRAFLEGHPHVTVVRTNPEWWLGKRPHQLNVRQRVNANITRTLVAPFPEVEWIVHIDADECVLVDRARTGEIPADADSIRLRPLEAVSRRRPKGEVTAFKRLLDDDDLALLQVLGVIPDAHNRHYFRGHIDGKAGIRPRLDRWLTLHHAADATGEDLEGFEAAWLRLLHYESPSGEEFVRKWTALLNAGPNLKLRSNRSPIAAAVRALMGKELSEKQARAYLMRVYEHTREDDVDTLAELGLLEQVDPGDGMHQPAAFAPDTAEQLTLLAAHAMSIPKWPFHTGETAAAAAEVMHEVAGHFESTEPRLAAAVRAVVPTGLPTAPRSDGASGEGQRVVEPDDEAVGDQAVEAPRSL